MLDSVFSMLLTSLSRRLFTEHPTRRVGNRHPETYPVDSFATSDGDIVLVGFSDAIVRRIGEAMANPAWRMIRGSEPIVIATRTKLNCAGSSPTGRRASHVTRRSALRRRTCRRRRSGTWTTYCRAVILRLAACCRRATTASSAISPWSRSRYTFPDCADPGTRRRRWAKIPKRC